MTGGKKPRLIGINHVAIEVGHELTGDALLMGFGEADLAPMISHPRGAAVSAYEATIIVQNKPLRGDLDA
jgi:hypothetical protein